ncbi:MAG TPA: CNNM domain-containing protein [Kiritimatiellia bacterium]|nr:CNNM domain-containing protein [Kiritimatiellia bacterium]HMO98443.1 CNNM domain-containing protein [Kiritimatiellia bacterium]HMP95861.1 CNNM domain-containing protein [Kiritimatiellia bacterium]
MTAIEFVIIAACLIGSAFFSGIETGMISINRLRLRHLVRHKIKGADILQDFLEKPDYLLGTTLVGNNIVNTMLSIVAVSVGGRLFGITGSWMASVGVTLTLLVLCEYLPKAWFRSFPSRRCLPFAGALRVMGRILHPFSHAMMSIVRLLTPFMNSATGNASPAITRDEVLHLVREGQKSGALSQDEVRMITGVFELRTMTCAEVMTPRKDMVYIHPDTLYDDILMFARAQQADQFAVFDRERQMFTGMVYVFDILADDNPKGKCAKDYMRPPQLVAAATPVDHVLPRMRVTKQPIVLVTDEKYQVVGSVTLDLVLQEIVGT